MAREVADDELTDDECFEYSDTALGHAIALTQFVYVESARDLIQIAIGFSHYLQTGEMPPDFVEEGVVLRLVPREDE